MTGGPAAQAEAERREELAANLAEVRDRIARAERAAGRAPGDVTLIVVTKTWPASDVRLLAGLGATDVGENRDQEAMPKHEACADLPLRWHFIGQLQRNKARHVASYADVVQSVDRPELVGALDRAAAAAGRTLDVLLQVGLAAVPDGTPPAHRGGAAPSDVPALADLVAASGSLRLAGVMAVAPLGPDGEPADPRGAFGRLADVAAGLRAAHPSATMISAGMSGDLEDAVAAGATHVRVGTAVLGGRPRLR
jgi:pyridoxal phosphate enzyme (YggS family)